MRRTYRSTTRVTTRRGRLLEVGALALLVAFTSGTARADVNRIVLRVNDRIVTLHDYEKAKLQRLEGLRRSNLPPDRLQEAIAELGVTVMSDLFEEMLMLARADQIDVAPTREEFEEAILRARESSGVTTDEEFQQALAASGLTYDEFRAELEKNLTVNGVMGREVRPRIQLNEEDLRRYYQTHLEEFAVPVRRKVREIVVLESGTSGPEERLQIAAQLRDKVLSGGGSDEMIAEFTEREVSTSWIDLGWIEPGDLAGELEAAIADLQPGELSEPVPARGGLHVMQVVERQEATVEDFSAVRDRIQQQETGKRFGEEIGEYMAELERSSYVIINPPPEAAAFRSVLQQRAEKGLEGPTERELALSVAGEEPPDEPADDSSDDDG